ncbi:uncharacterized protein LOC127876417 [Dreissena polymorpha]|uniref:uncharacterized protein LOC127876417 n=1 Tax=Dreissena polymorpha TaxID=45954 RepID=UPI0022649386|nr:uncharacterized protein LOC127876417 [Dreissena polymorpha]XP_052277641.1 uncharacterized protein LOC127876417 [Dreissena polymorpha]XP_052277642.1 uncharacterized protein LOC127876417 [Dreissena polymorpha]XP_052277643.1 uncharacterized protein LOC127876417 [Dreissena polymorpha]XP_052277644.1 uncharacterized protein LOC127876417 [Dreissena polymorpha]
MRKQFIPPKQQRSGQRTDSESDTSGSSDVDKPEDTDTQMINDLTDSTPSGSEKTNISLGENESIDLNILFAKPTQSKKQSQASPSKKPVNPTRTQKATPESRSTSEEDSDDANINATKQSSGSQNIPWIKKHKVPQRLKAQKVVSENDNPFAKLVAEVSKSTVAKTKKEKSSLLGNSKHTFSMDDNDKPCTNGKKASNRKAGKATTADETNKSKKEETKPRYLQIPENDMPIRELFARNSDSDDDDEFDENENLYMQLVPQSLRTDLQPKPGTRGTSGAPGGMGAPGGGGVFGTAFGLPGNTDESSSAQQSGAADLTPEQLEETMAEIEELLKNHRKGKKRTKRDEEDDKLMEDVLRLMQEHPPVPASERPDRALLGPDTDRLREQLMAGLGQGEQQGQGDDGQQTAYAMQRSMQEMGGLGGDQAYQLPQMLGGLGGDQANQLRQMMGGLGGDQGNQMRQMMGGLGGDQGNQMRQMMGGLGGDQGNQMRQMMGGLGGDQGNQMRQMMGGLGGDQGNQMRQMMGGLGGDQGNQMRQMMGGLGGDQGNQMRQMMGGLGGDQGNQMRQMMGGLGGVQGNARGQGAPGGGGDRVNQFGQLDGLSGIGRGRGMDEGQIGGNGEEDINIADPGEGEIMNQLLTMESIKAQNNAAPKAQEGMSTIIIFDTSNSMAGDGIVQATEFITAFLKGLEDIRRAANLDENVALITVSESVDVAHHLTNEFSKIREILHGIYANGPTKLHQALLLPICIFGSAPNLGIRNFGSHVAAPRVILISDGRLSIRPDDSPQSQEENLLKNEALKTMTSSTEMTMCQLTCIPVGNCSREFLAFLAESTGGQMYETSKAKQLSHWNMYHSIVATLKQQGQSEPTRDSIHHIISSHIGRCDGSDVDEVLAIWRQPEPDLAAFQRRLQERESGGIIVGGQGSGASGIGGMSMMGGGQGMTSTMPQSIDAGGLPTGERGFATPELSHGSSSAQTGTQVPSRQVGREESSQSLAAVNRGVDGSQAEGHARPRTVNNGREDGFNIGMRDMFHMNDYAVAQRRRQIEKERAELDKLPKLPAEQLRLEKLPDTGNMQWPSKEQLRPSHKLEREVTTTRLVSDVPRPAKASQRANRSDQTKPGWRIRHQPNKGPGQKKSQSDSSESD